jgi:hypothetical protein
VNRVTALIPDTAAFNTGLLTIANEFTKLANKPEELGRIANDASQFYLTALLDRYHRPTDVTLTVARRAAGTEDEYRPLTSKRINFGGRARWSFSAGIAASTLGNNDYGVRTSRIAAPAGIPGDTLASIVVATKSSQANVFPMITFNTRLTPSTYGVNPQLVLGVGTNNVNNARVGFYVGGGVDAFGERVVLTVGALLGEETRLANGLQLGDRVMNGQAVVKEVRMMARPAISLTYRMF